MDSKSTADSTGFTGQDRDTHTALAVQWVFPETDGGRVTWLNGGPRSVGRAEDCDTCLPGDQVSRRHVELRRTGRVFVLRDLESKNGAYLNGERVARAAFVPGDVLRVGEWVGVAVEASEDEVLRIGELAPGMVGGVILRRLLERARNAAKSNLPVVLIGETGTGKEWLARAIHAWSERGGPWLAVNCAGYLPGLAATELFGHRKGAFTGADRSSEGHIRAAGDGTLFLDEVAELPLGVQAQLLRVLEQREVLPVGESKARAVDVRFIAAAQVSLAQLVSQERFRSDLQARLEGLVLELPPLRERRGDIPFLCQYLLAKHATHDPPRLAPCLVERLCLQEWPLNVRELDLLLRRLLALSPGESLLKLSKVADVIGTDTKVAANHSGPSRATRRPKPSPYSSNEVWTLQAALERCGGNLSRAAAEVGITRGKAYRLLESLKKDGRD